MSLLVALRAEDPPQPMSIARFETLFGVTYLKALTYADWKVEQGLARRCARADKKGKIGILARWLGTFHDKALSEGAIPPVAIRWIDPQIGYGLFATQPFVPWQYVGEYTGLLRPRNWLRPETNDYCFMYPRAWWPGGEYLIDSQYHGNYTRFINHSDTPNCESVSVFQQGRFHILFRAIKPIASGEEFTYDYGDLYWNRRKKQTPETQDAEAH